MRTSLAMFDLFGTVLDVASADRDDLRDYGDQLAEFRRSGQWRPLTLPESWAELPAFPDAREGLDLLRQKGYTVVTLSNAPLDLQRRVLAHNGLAVDGIVPLEAARVYKTHPAAYLLGASTWRCEPSACAMVSGNRTFGDIETAAALGMRGILIRDPSADFATITDLAEFLPCH